MYVSRPSSGAAATMAATKATARIAATDLLPWHHILREAGWRCVRSEWECEVDGAGVYIESARRWSDCKRTRKQMDRWLRSSLAQASETKVASGSV
jgi:predicted metallo-beta-lactamase superfamily hydrolase